MERGNGVTACSNEPQLRQKIDGALLGWYTVTTYCLSQGVASVCTNNRNRRGAIITDRLRFNNRIRAREVRLIDEEGTQVGIVAIRDALQMAEERGFDLVEVAPNAVPPVCRIMDYGKFRYEQSKKEREARKHQKQVELKEVRLKPKTDSHDIDVKVKQARKFLQAGDKVKFTLRFRGREIFHPDIGLEMLERMAEDLRDVAVVEQKPLMEGRVLSLLLAPSTKARQQGSKATQGGPKPEGTKPAPVAEANNTADVAEEE